MKLAVVASGDFFSDYGGGQVYVRNIVDELAKRNDVTASVISFSKSAIAAIKDYNGINVYQVNDEDSFRDALMQIQPDIVHANGEKLVAARLCKETGIPCIVTAHHGGLVCPAGTLLNTEDEICRIPADYSHCLKCYLRNTPTGLFWYPLLKHYSQKHYCQTGKRLEKLPTIPFLTPIGRTGLIVTQKLNDWKELRQLATHFIAPSDAMAEALQRNGCPAEKISIIPHGIPQNNSQSSSPFHVPRSPIIHFYYVGRINYVKGIHILLEAFSGIDNPNTRLHLVGDAATKGERRYADRLKRKYRKDSRIVWHGKMPAEQVGGLVKEFHCLVHPAIYLEVFGLTIGEAIAQHKYVIATRCGGAEMQIHSEADGILVEPNKIDELANAIKKYLTSPHNPNRKIRSINEHTSDLIRLFQEATKNV